MACVVFVRAVVPRPADNSKELARVGPGQCFGEMALLSGDTRAANVMALDNSEVRGHAWTPLDVLCIQTANTPARFGHEQHRTSPLRLRVG